MAGGHGSSRSWGGVRRHPTGYVHQHLVVAVAVVVDVVVVPGSEAALVDGVAVVVCHGAECRSILIAAAADADGIAFVGGSFVVAVAAAATVAGPSVLGGDGEGGLRLQLLLLLLRR